MTNWQREFRALVVLGRTSNLPTVWSNCLAGWILSGGGSVRRFSLLCLGTSCLYLGGMFLNDACDVDFDRQHRKERPIPSGSISLGQVWGWGLGWLVAGLLLLSLLGTSVLLLAIALVVCIVLYDAIHKVITLSPVLMATCRWLLYVIASAATGSGRAGLAIWSGLALAFYILGLSYFARGERGRDPAPFWPGVFLGAPMVLAWIVNEGEFKLRAIFFSGLLSVWIVRCLREAFWVPNPSIGRTVAGLLAGICLVDLLAVDGGTIASGSAFLFLFALSLFAQRFVPAT